MQRQCGSQSQPSAAVGTASATHAAEAGQAAAIDPPRASGIQSFKHQQCLEVGNEKSNDEGRRAGMETSCSCSLLGQF